MKPFGQASEKSEQNRPFFSVVSYLHRSKPLRLAPNFFHKVCNDSGA